MKDVILIEDTILLGDITPTKKLILVETFIDLVVGKEISIKSPLKKSKLNKWDNFIVLEVFVYQVEQESELKSYCVLLEKSDQ